LASFIQPPFCERCGDPVAGRVDHAFTCALCAQRPTAFDGARSVVRYDGALGEAIRRLKYHRAVWIVDDLAELLEAGVRTHYADLEFDVVTWVPLHFSRARERGFNQAAELARQLAMRLGCRAASTLLRVRPTQSQTRLTIPERVANVRHAFRAWRHGKGRTALLVDDVMTTGATVHACAAALKQADWAQVWVITVARG
jgi:ComF family protein